jgi:tetratricopeptide (TPR) repeat protein
MLINEIRGMYSKKIGLIRIFLTLLWLIILFVLQFTIVNATSIAPVDKTVEDAILAENWTKVASLLDSVNPQTPPPVLRLIKGHACLALNRNNESLCLFLSASSENDLKEWEKWSQYFEKTHPEKAISHYFRGDALARLEKWEEALTSFNKALELNPKHALVLNARGVAYAGKGKLDLARNDFDKAIKINQAFADPYSNLGARFIQMKDGAEGAIRAFNKALKISPDFALALHGRGLVKWVLRDFRKAEEDLQNAVEQGGCGIELMAENEIRIEAYLAGVRKEEVKGKIGEIVAELKSGMYLHKSFSTMSQDRLMDWAANQFSHAYDLSAKGGFMSGFRERINANQGVNGLMEISRIYGQDGVSKALDITRQKGVPDSYIKSQVGIVNTYNLTGGKVWADGFKQAGDVTFSAGLLIAKNPITIEKGLSIATAGVLMKSTGNMFERSSNLYTSNLPQLDKHIQNYQSQNPSPSINNLSNKTLGNNIYPGGVDTNPSEMNWDEGKWPFVEYYGLLYGVKSKETFLKERGE